MLPPSELRTRTWCGSAQLKWRSQQPLGRASVAAFAHVDAKGRVQAWLGIPCLPVVPRYALTPTVSHRTEGCLGPTRVVVEVMTFSF